jgi:hypothetical protein
MNFDPHEPPFNGQVASFISVLSSEHQKMVLQVKAFDFTVPERYSDRDGKQMQMLLLKSECP